MLPSPWMIVFGGVAAGSFILSPPSQHSSGVHDLPYLSLGSKALLAVHSSSHSMYLVVL